MKIKNYIIPFLLILCALTFTNCGGDLTGVGPSGPVPDSPNAAIVLVGNGQLSLSWTVVDGATSYEVWSHTENDSASAIINGVYVTDTNFILSGLTNGTTYYVWLKAKDSSGTSNFGTVISETPFEPLGAPDAPEAATIIVGNGQLSISWTAVPTATLYEVWYFQHNFGNSSSNAAQWGEEISEANTIITGLTNGITCNIWIKAKNIAGTSGFGTRSSNKPATIPTVFSTPIAGNYPLSRFITGTTAGFDGEILSTGGASVTDQGLCWNTTGNPTLADSNETFERYNASNTFKPITLSGLIENTEYYVRAYATNAMGTGYSDEIVFNSGKIYGTDFEGGYVFYNDGYGHGLVSAKSAQPTMVDWIEGGSTLTTLNGNTSTELGTGMANTNAIIMQEDHLNSAAKVCDDYTDGTYSDWFLPSSSELYNINERILENITIFRDYSEGFYYSSSEESASTIYCIFFYNPSPVIYTQSKERTYGRILPVRSF